MTIFWPSVTQRRMLLASIFIGAISGCEGDSGNSDTPIDNEPPLENSNDTSATNTNTDSQQQTNGSTTDNNTSGLLRLQLSEVNAEARFVEEVFLNVDGASNGTDTVERVESFTIKGCEEDDVFFLSNDFRENSSTVRGYIEVFAGTCIRFDTPWIEPSPATNNVGVDDLYLFVTTQSNAAPETEQNAEIDLRTGSDDVYSVTLPGTGQVTFVQDVRFGEVFAERYFEGLNDEGGRLTDDRVTHFMSFTWSMGFEDCTFNTVGDVARCTELDGL